MTTTFATTATPSRTSSPRMDSSSSPTARRRKVGTITSGWEFFSEWKKINSEGEEGSVSLETVIRGMCTKERLLDIIENFVAFQDLPGGFVKLLARNHQYLGVNNALARMEELRHAQPAERGKLGVFWHTQGSGKTLSMLAAAGPQRSEDTAPPGRQSRPLT